MARLSSKLNGTASTTADPTARPIGRFRACFDRIRVKATGVIKQVVAARNAHAKTLEAARLGLSLGGLILGGGFFVPTPKDYFAAGLAFFSAFDSIKKLDDEIGPAFKAISSAMRSTLNKLKSLTFAQWDAIAFFGSLPLAFLWDNWNTILTHAPTVLNLLMPLKSYILPAFPYAAPAAFGVLLVFLLTDLGLHFYGKYGKKTAQTSSTD